MLSPPRSVQELTPAWMTAALGARFPGVVVDRVEMLRVDEGTNRRAVVGLRYGAGDGPARVFVKMQSTVFHRLMLRALGALSSEARLAGAAVRLPLPHPELYAGAFDPRRLRAIVVMEDVTTRRGRPNDATSSLALEGVRSGLEGLATLHAAYWERPLPAELAFLRPWRLGGALAAISRANLARGLWRLRERGHAGLLPSGLSAALLDRQFRAGARLALSGPQTVLHGDPHPGNTYLLPGPVTGFYDWQLVRTGHWSHDLGYFLVSSLAIPERRSHERDLIRLYLERLADKGATAPTFEAAWSRYRATPAFGLGTWLHTYAFGGLQPREACLATLERFAAAYQDLETAAAPGLHGRVG
ncbi:MAG: phosphotransferase [Candidatus Dormibacteraeota bacterium]|nr:phosphotransferase [Candidatus Dormibacteraeota bacterium]MBO0743399.1 phosphotransferase [Candidatus Dormibacteraeota bacterium]